MVDSDADSWYDWRRGDDLNEMPRGKNFHVTNDAQLSGVSRFNDLTSNDSQGSSLSNGLIHYDAVPTSSRSGAGVRFINPAIYAETMSKEDEEVKIRVKVSSKDNGQIAVNCGDSMEMSDRMSTLSIKNNLAARSIVDHAGDQGLSQETYRCYSFNSPTMSFESGVARSKSMSSCEPSTRVERRCRIADRTDNDELCTATRVDTEVQRYTLNGLRVVRVSTTSLSSISISESSGDPAKKLTYSEWIRKKQQVAQEKKEQVDEVERKRRLEAEKLAREKEERESRERENFMRWSERKKREEERKKAMVEKELELQRQLQQIEDKAVVAKTLCLRQWERKKKEEEKVRRRKEEKKQKQLDEEKKKRLEESTKAYENWRKMAKNKPKPATQGLLPHQNAKPAYVNPTPWQRIVDDFDDVEENASTVRKISSKNNASSYQ